ncbi:hemicentin-1-like isoform X2 [Mya arenaria]|uniref:hemicentin-1-like isoform X2 n=1 Tax=Mya arenaria TaxID=6604 RepID=UPI0022E179B6|nr:hemicentin-1-like isoform X2 [Mya arenaria]
MMLTYFVILLVGRVRSGTLTGNGKSGGFTVQENASLEVTCSTSIDAGEIFIAEKSSRLHVLASRLHVLGRARLHNGSRGCVIYHLRPPLLSCSCVSSRELICVIRTVTRAMNGDVWFCLYKGDSFDREGGIIVVTVGITSVSMVSPAGNSVSIIEDTAQHFRCETSVGNPQATVEWYKDNGTLDRSDDTEIITGKETNTSASVTLIVTVGKLSLTVQRNDHKVGVYCRANNGGDWLYSSSVVLDVQFGPKVQLPQTYDVLEGSVVNYSCSFIPGNPPSQTSFVWTRSIDRRQWNSPFFSIASVQKLDDDMYTCTATPAGSPAQTGNSGTMHLNVQFGITSVSMVSPAGNSVSIKEDTAQHFRCETSVGNPQATVEWYKDNGTLDRSDDTEIITGKETNTSASVTLIVTVGKLSLTVQRNDHKVGVYCRANNGGDWLYSSSVVLDVQFGPKVQLPQTYDVLEGSVVNYSCSFIPGNPPSQTSFVWTRSIDRRQWNSQFFSIASVQKLDDDMYTCTATPAGSPAQTGNSGTMHLNVQFGITSVSMVSPAGNSVSIIEDTAQHFRCETSVGNPQATVEWYKDNGILDRSDDTEIITGKETNTSASVTLIVTVGKLSLTVQRNDHKVGVYCRANNGGDWLYSSSVVLDVQFGPKVQLPQTYDVLEGSVVNYSCSFIPGNPPSQTSFVWTRSIDRRQWNSQFFSIASVQKLDDDMYTCTATPAGSPAQTGNSGTMHLNVQYKSSVTQFHVTGNRNEANVTQTEKSSTTFTCMVDSNPPSTIKIKKDGELRRSVNHSTQLEYTIENLSCTDAGLYTCDASNQFNFKKHSTKDLHMLVTCSPRRPPGKDIKLNFTARLHNSVTLQYTVVAYPVPSASQFVWKRCFRRKMCIQLSNITAKYEITTSGLSSSLTIVDTDIDDFGAYSLSVKNGIGKELVEDLFLQPFVGITSVSMVSPAGNSVSIIEDTAQQFRCETSVGNPQATVEWYKDNGTLDRSDDTEIITGKETNTSAIGTLIVTVGKLSLTVQRNDHKVGVYCRANNGGDWLYSSSVVLDVQFGPKVQLPQTYDVLEGSVVNYSCSFIPGNPPSQTSFVWTRSIDRRQWNSPFFSIASVQKLDDDMYTCTATPAGSPAQTGNSGTMHLNVQYKSSVTQFHVTGNRNEANVTQTEKSSTTFTCMVDSIPPSTIKIKKDGELRRSVNHSTQLEYTIANLSCTDAGLYTCDASNQFNFKKHSTKDLHMLVTCSPRRPPGKDIKLNFTARLHNSVTLQYTVVAYPVPSASQFVWKRCFRRKMCIQLSNITAKYEITTSGLSSSLTIVDTDIDDFGAYSLSVKNGIGKELVEDLFLQPFEVADAKPHIAAIAGGVTAGVITMVAIVVVFCLLRKGSRSRPTVPVAEIPGHSAAVTYETLSAKNNTPVYDALEDAVYQNTMAKNQVQTAL